MKYVMAATGLVLIAAAGLGVWMKVEPKPTPSPMPTVIEQPATVRLAPARAEDDDRAWYIGTVDGCVPMYPAYDSATADEYLQTMADDGVSPPVQWSSDRRIAFLYDLNGERLVMILAQGSGHCAGATNAFY